MGKILHKLSALILTAAIVILIPSVPYAESIQTDLNIYVNGSFAGSVPSRSPITEDTMIPINNVLDLLGASITRDSQAADTYIIEKKADSADIHVQLQLKNNTIEETREFTGDGTTISYTYTLDKAPYAFNDNILAPIEFLTDAFDLKTDSHDESNTLYMSEPHYYYDDTASLSEVSNEIINAVSVKKKHLFLKISDYNQVTYDNYFSILADLFKTSYGSESFKITIDTYETSQIDNAFVHISLEYGNSIVKAGTDEDYTRDTSNTNVNISRSNDSFPVSKSPETVTVTSQTELYEQIEAAIKECKEKIVVYFKDCEGEKLFYNSYSLATKALEENPDLLLGSIDYKNSSYDENESKAVLYFDYTYDPDKVMEMRKTVEDKAESIINAIITPGMSDLEKERVIHDYIVSNAQYDQENWLKDTIPVESRSPYGILIIGKAVCQGYARTAKMLLNLAGIESIVVDGSAQGGGHSWNIVKINGHYYHLDTTFDDPIYATTDVISHYYFNLSDNEMRTDHQWDEDSYPHCFTFVNNTYNAQQEYNTPQENADVYQDIPFEEPTVEY